MWASGWGHVMCIRELLKGGAKANQKDKVSTHRL